MFPVGIGLVEATAASAFCGTYLAFFASTTAFSITNGAFSIRRFASSSADAQPAAAFSACALSRTARVRAASARTSWREALTRRRKQPFACPEAATSAARVAAPFSMLSIKYPNWEAVQSVVGTNQPVIARVAEDGTETPVSVAFFTPNKQAARLAQVEPLLKAIYDKAWALTESVPYAPSPTLTKSVMRKPYGLNGSPYALAAEANDTPNATTDETLESVLARAIEVEVQGAHKHAQLLDDLRTPSYHSTLVHGKSVATAISAMCAFLVPYRVDGTPVAAPTGLLMRETESWPVEPLRKIGMSAEDCDGSAGVASAAGVGDAVVILWIFS